ncbi:alpha/beta fold hydrolase [uncultured Xylophilus sp.]|uniref:alpha/beta fold hydrolase n=1 Tax=uncultured Xylophilus sp. TaxID=296832 RepID=UPI0025EED842|nr:alpha/beta fold hydrolase [uncultured Xylophilus sp.]
MTQTQSTRLPSGVSIAWRQDDFTDGWKAADTVMLLHGIAEDGDAFSAWVPHLARDFRVLRPDLRGFGASSPIDGDAPLDIAMFADDLDALVQALGLARVHAVATKLGAQAALVLAQRGVPWLASMALAGMQISPGGALGRWVDAWIDLVDREGVEGWARATMPGRLGATLPPEAMDWWARAMGRAPAASVKACLRMLPGLGEAPALESIRCPTLVLAAVQPGEADGFDQRTPLAKIARWQQRIPGSRLCRIKADAYHVAASHPDLCAAAVRSFLLEVSR